MNLFRRLGLVVASIVSMAGCASVERLDAASDVHALLVAIRDDDKAAFEAHVDRPALEREIGARLSAEIAKPNADPTLRAIGALLGPAAADIAGDVLLRPSVFRAVAEYYGYQSGQPLPGRVAIAGVLKPMGDGRVCATRKKDGPCLLVFTQEEGVWKLSGFQGDASMLRPAS